MSTESFDPAFYSELPTIDQLFDEILPILPNASFGRDNHGQVVIYTNLVEKADRTLIDFPMEKFCDGCQESIYEDGDGNWVHGSDGARFCERPAEEDEESATLCRPADD